MLGASLTTPLQYDSILCLERFDLVRLCSMVRLKASSWSGGGASYHFEHREAIIAFAYTTYSLVWLLYHPDKFFTAPST